MILRVEDLVVAYGEHQVLDGITFELNAGEIIMVAGANGAGKSTLLRALTGFVSRKRGTFSFAGKVFTPRPHEMAHRGIVYIPQDTRVFPGMTVRENILIGGFLLQKAEKEERFSAVCRLFSHLEKKLELPAAVLSGGERQMVALARGLMSSPRVMLLDEPSVGLAPKLVGEVFEKLREINNRFQISLIIVEHNLKTLLSMAQRALILAKGKIVLEGPPEKVLHSQVLEEVFFGDLA